MPQFPTNGQYGGGWPNNPSMRRPWIKSGQQAIPQNNQSSVDYWNQQIGAGFNQQPMQVNAQQIKAPTMGNDWEKYLKDIGAQFQQVSGTNVNAPTLSQDYLKYINAGTQNINAAGLQDTAALLRSYDPILQQQQEQGFSQAAMRAGKTGMWGSPYAQALGAETAKASNQRANIANQYLYQASEQAANRQLQAEIQNRQNQLQAAGMSAEMARAQAQMELSAAQGNQQTGLQASMANQQAQIQQRAQQLQAAGLSADQAYRQAQLEVQTAQSNQQADLTAQQANQAAQQKRLDQLLQGQQQSMTYGIQRDQLTQQQKEERNRQIQNMMDRFMQIYGDIIPPDELWKWLDNWFNTGGQAGMPPFPNPNAGGGGGGGNGGGGGAGGSTPNPYAPIYGPNPGQS